MSIKNVKKFSIIIMITFLLLSKSFNSKSKDKTTIGVIQFTQHSALDNAKKGFVDEIEKNYPEINIEYLNAQGSIPNIITIGRKFLRDEVDLIYGISTPVVQGLKNINNKIPVIFTAITDPVKSGIVDSFNQPNCNFTGTTDQAPIKKQLQLFKDFKEDIKTIGIIYNTSETNSLIQVEQVKKEAKKLNLQVKTIGVSSISEIPKATESIIRKVEGIYTPADNMIASSINIIAEKSIENNIITVGAEEAHVKGGILITSGINYYDLGKQSAHMATDILLNGKDINKIPVENSKNIETVVNIDTFKKLNLKYKEKELDKYKKIQKERI